jgi:hypothetical protein
VAVWGAEQVVLPALDVAPPLRETPVRETAFDVLHHGVYVIATSLASAAMQESRPEFRRFATWHTRHP